MATPPRMLLLDGGPGGEAFVLMPPTYEVSVLERPSFSLVGAHAWSIDPVVHLADLAPSQAASGLKTRLTPLA